MTEDSGSTESTNIPATWTPGPTQDSAKSDSRAPFEDSAQNTDLPRLAEAENGETDPDDEDVTPWHHAQPSDANQAENRQSDYEPIASPTADSRVSIGVAGLVADSVRGPVTVMPQIRVRDVLSGSPVDRERFRSDLFYVGGQEWSSAWQEATEALAKHSILVVVAPRGYGSTTFSLRLLARHTTEDTHLIQLEADWGSPKIDKLPLEQNRAYQIDLQDPEHDRLSSAFLNGLEEHAKNLEALGSHLVVAVADEVWPGHYGQVPHGVAMLRLNDPPDAQQLVERHLTARQLGSLVPYVKQPEAARHIQGRDVIQAMRAVEVIVRQWHEYCKHELDESTFSGSTYTETASAVSGQQSSALDEGLQRAIEQALGDWSDDLDGLFNEATAKQRDGRSLSPQDRCLLMSLALRQTGTAAEIEEAALALEQTLTKSRLRPTSGAADAWDIFSRRGLRPRLKAFQAAIDTRDRVTFNRPGYSEAVMAYVWDNYSGLRDDLVTWMAGCAAGIQEDEDPAAETLTALILRLQDADRLPILRDSAIAQGREDVIVRIMTAAAEDDHMGRRARGLLYDWASQRPQIQHVVIAVCRELIHGKEEIALVRLRRVANHATDDGVRKHVLAVLKDVAATREFVARFAGAVASWQRTEPTSLAVKLGLLALLETEYDGIPYIPPQVGTIDVTHGLREILADTSTLTETVPVLVGWMKSCTRDSDLYLSARNLIADAIRDRQSFSAGMIVMKELTGITKPDGGNVGEDLYGEIAQPELRSLNPLI